MHDHDPLSWPDAPVGSLRAWDAGVTWREIETAPGAFDFSRLDAIVETGKANDSDVLLVLGQTPAFHAKDPASESFYGEGAFSPPRLGAWKRYVPEVAERYADEPVALQVWNETNVSGFWSGTPAQMATLTKATYDVLATVSPRPTLVAPALVTRLIGQSSGQATPWFIPGPVTQHIHRWPSSQAGSGTLCFVGRCDERLVRVTLLGNSDTPLESIDRRSQQIRIHDGPEDEMLPCRVFPA